MATWNNIIKRALLEIGVLEGGEEPEAHLVTEGIELLKEMLDQWALEGLLSPGTTDLTHTFSAATASKTITIGPSNNNPTIETDDVPFRINHIEYGSGDYSYALRALSRDAYLDRQEQFTNLNTDDPPYLYWYEPDVPTGKLRLDTKPSPGDKLIITTEKYLIASNISESDEANLFRGYAKAVRLNLAIDMASSNGIKGGQLSPITVKQAEMAKDEIRLINLQRGGQTKFDPSALQNSRMFNRRASNYYGSRFNY